MAADRDGSRVAATAARLLAVLAVALAALAVALPVVSGLGYLEQLIRTPEVVVATSFSITGALLVAHPPARRMGWLLLAVGAASAVYISALSWTAYALGGDDSAVLPSGAGFAAATAWVASWAWLPSWLVVSTVLPQVVPHGRPLPARGWRWSLVCAAVLGLVGVVTIALTPGPFDFFPGIDNPLGVEAVGPVAEVVQPAVQLGMAAPLVIAIASVVVRVRRADGVERRQVGWVGYAVALTVLAIVVVPSGWANLVVLLVPAGIAVAALRYRLYDLDLLVNRTIVAVLLVAGAALLYVALIGWVGALVGTSEGAVPFVAAFAIATAFHPARVRLQRLVDRLLYGLRGDPYALIQAVDQSLREAATPREALAAGVETVRSGLRLRGVSVLVRMPDGSEVEERAGEAATAATVPLELHGRQVGELRVVRAPGRDAPTVDGPAPPTGADARALQAVAGPLSAAAYAVRLSGALEESRTQLVQAREDERRRLRRDLHDGLGPLLAGVVMALDVVRSALARGDGDRAAELSGAAAEQARSAVTDVRRLVADLRPPALDDLGLVGALKGLVSTLTAGGPEIDVHATGRLDELPAAVEVAAYRIAAEAVNNAVRHSDASRVDLSLAAGDAGLKVHVRDDGGGLPAELTPGVGLASMRERAAELGGWCNVETTTDGTGVRAWLPYDAPHAPAAGPDDVPSLTSTTEEVRQS
ncbi:sensor histidine kinase [Nocardioides KLBMP 9356]|uniref:Sensor histidine kinase n=1 Tax=Nocardioides potassii TaxID=2911371 RepID=A0ABS9HGW2_9ACTN|nr:sensor histidine kinase [Nocardioides potassii]MCF6379371.1 sensor histidine kinase [Nocardioides potassii]